MLTSYPDLRTGVAALPDSAAGRLGRNFTSRSGAHELYWLLGKRHAGRDRYSKKKQRNRDARPG